jgi:hypothetical protein
VSTRITPFNAIQPVLPASQLHIEPIKVTVTVAIDARAIARRGDHVAPVNSSSSATTDENIVVVANSTSDARASRTASIPTSGTRVVAIDELAAFPRKVSATSSSAPISASLRE